MCNRDAVGLRKRSKSTYLIEDPAFDLLGIDRKRAPPKTDQIREPRVRSYRDTMLFREANRCVITLGSPA